MLRTEGTKYIYLINLVRYYVFSFDLVLNWNEMTI